MDLLRRCGANEGDRSKVPEADHPVGGAMSTRLHSCESRIFNPQSLVTSHQNEYVELTKTDRSLTRGVERG